MILTSMASHGRVLRLEQHNPSVPQTQCLGQQDFQGPKNVVKVVAERGWIMKYQKEKKKGGSELIRVSLDVCDP